MVEEAAEVEIREKCQIKNFKSPWKDFWSTSEKVWHSCCLYSFFLFFRPENGSLLRGCPAEETDSWVITALLAGENNQCGYLQFSALSFSNKHAIILNRRIISMFGLELICYQHTDIHFLFTSQSTSVCSLNSPAPSTDWAMYKQRTIHSLLAMSVDQWLTDHTLKSQSCITCIFSWLISQRNWSYSCS